MTAGNLDLRTPPKTPAGTTLLYQITLPFQVAARMAAAFVNVREGRVKGVDFENGTDVVVFDSVTSFRAAQTVSINRNHAEVNPHSDPPGQPATMVKYPVKGGFVPFGARRADGAPHPHAGTGFGLNQSIAWRTQYPGPPPYGVNMFGRDPATGGPSRPAESYDYLELHQFSYDGRNFRVVKTERVSHRELLPGWTIGDGGLTNAIPDGDDLLLAMSGGKEAGRSGSGVMRWQRRGELWKPASFVPVTGADSSGEASLVRDVDGALLFCARGSRDPRHWEASESETPDNDIRVWRSGDGGQTWKKIIHVRGAVSSAPITLNQAADGTPYIAANLYEVFLHPMDRMKIPTDSRGRVLAGGRARNTLCLWPLSQNRASLGTPLIARDCLREFGAPPGNTAWRIDHPSAMTVHLADGEWHNVLGVRVLEYGELTHALAPTPRTGAYLEEVVSTGPAIPIWRF